MGARKPFCLCSTASGIPPGGEGGNRRAAGKGFKNDVGKVVLGERGRKYVACCQQGAEFLFFINATDVDRGER